MKFNFFQKKIFLTAGAIFFVLFILTVGMYFIRKNDLTLDQELNKFGIVGKEVVRDFSSVSQIAPTKADGGAEIVDNMKEGLDIQFAGQEDQTEKPENNLKVTFPESLNKPLIVNLPGGKTITIIDKTSNGQMSIIANQTSNDLKNKDRNDIFKKAGIAQDKQKNFVQYKSDDERRTSLYSYQKDQATGESKLKNWTLYANGNGKESESYVFENAKISLDESGNANVFFDDGQDAKNKQVMADVSASLMERAQKTIMKDSGTDILAKNKNAKPDFIIPHPYYIDNSGQLIDLKWKVSEDAKSLFLDFEVKSEQYPIALDPTLQFTAPGQSNSSSVITGESIGDYLGWAMAIGDFNDDGRSDLAVSAMGKGNVYIFFNNGSTSIKSSFAADIIIKSESLTENFGSSLVAGDFNSDGKIDIAVGARDYATSTGRAYIFYNDGSIPTIAANANVIISGEAINNQFGFVMTAGDFNADGRTDLAVGSPMYSSGTGRTYIFYNDGSIPTTAAAADVKITGEVANDNFGNSMTAGDFNADGRMDLAIGSPYYSSFAGRTYIFYNDGSIPTTAATADVKINGETNGTFGWTMVAGDLNSDGRTDLIVGADAFSVLGNVYIFYNDGSIPTTAATADVKIASEAGMPIGQSMTVGDFNADGRTDLAVGGGSTPNVYIFYNDGSIPTTVSSADVIIKGESNSFGWSMTAGDFNNDSKTDLVVGSYAYSSQTGRAYIFYSQNGQVNTNKSINGEASSLFGSSMISGDFNSDGRVDLAVGASNYSSGTGRVYIFYNDGSIPTISTAADVIITGNANSGFGSVMTAGDFNADGRMDLAIATAYSSASYDTVGIFYNDGSIPTTLATADVIITGETKGDKFGQSIISGDFNFDGRVDLAVGASNYSSGTGMVYVFYNDGSIPTTAATADIKITGEAASDNFGLSMTSGDFNADGRVDLAVGAIGYSSYAGRAYIFYNDGSIPTTAATADVKITGDADSRLGYSMVSGDFNADGKIDLAVGSINYITNFGRAYIFYNDGSIPTTAATADVRIDGEGVESYFSYSMVAGDFNADSRTDLVVGAVMSKGVYIFYNDGSIPTTAVTADVVIHDDLGSYFGRSLVSGDFNSDGRVDLVVGCGWNLTDAGRILFYETRNNFAWQIQKNENPTRFLGNIGQETKITGVVGSNFGLSMTTGDFNSDGRIDLAVGASGYSSNTGRVYIFYNDGSISTSANSADIIITGEAANDFFGESIVAGDFNADGRTDLAVGASYKTSYTGRAYVFYNDGSIPTTAASADAIIGGEATNNRFGVNMIAEDFNADGKTDLAISSTMYSSNVGRVYIFFNGAFPASASSASKIITGEAGTGFFGISMTAGDLNSDGKTDLTVGSSSKNKAYIFYNGLTQTTAATANIIIVGDASTGFGSAMTTGDFNFDGKIDLAVGAGNYNGGDGRVYIFNNDGSIPTTTATADVTITGEVGLAGQFGGWAQSMVAGDFNFDGRTDLAIGSPYITYGKTYIFNNDGSIPTTAATADAIVAGEGGNFGISLVSADLNFDGRTDLIVGDGYQRAYIYTSNEKKVIGETPGIDFGWSMTTGDLNSDGKKDLIVSAMGHDSYTGRVYIFYNDGSISNTAAGADVVITGEGMNSYFGLTLATGDLNFDGKTDLVVGAPNYSSNTGRVYVFYNDGLIPTTAASADVIITGELADSYFGDSLLIDDFSGDNRADLVVGADYYAPLATIGAVYIFYNDGSIPTTAASADKKITGDDAGGLFGLSLASVDLNSDGKKDLVVGAQNFSLDFVGEVYVFYNDGSIPSQAINADMKISGESALADDFFGAVMSVGDLNSDGKEDLIVGASGYGSDFGRVYVFYNDGSIPAKAEAADVKITGEAMNNYFGSAITLGDLNLDGKKDLVIGAGGYDANAGRVYIFYNNNGINNSEGAIKIDSPTAGISFGDSMVIDEFSGDGNADLVVGASGGGAFYIYPMEVGPNLAAPVAGRGNFKIRGNVKIR